MRELLLPGNLSQAITLISVKNYVGEEKSSTDVSMLLYESTVYMSLRFLSLAKTDE